MLKSKKIEIEISKMEIELSHIIDIVELSKDADILKGKIAESNIKLEKTLIIEAKKEEKKLLEDTKNSQDTVLSITLPEFKKTGKITEDSPFVYIYDLETITYYRIVEETGEKKKMMKDTIAFYIEQELGLSEKNARKMLKYIPKVDLDFQPSKEPRYFNDSTYTDTYNLFKETKYLKTKRTETIDVDTFIKKLDNIPAFKLLINNLFDNDDRMIRKFINWLSLIFQTKQKLPTSFVFQGPQGAGKGILFEIVISFIFGELYCTEITQDDLTSDFNTWAENKLFIIGDELQYESKSNTGNKMYNKLKKYVASKTITINPKGIIPFSRLNTANYLFNSNKKALKVEVTDRRYNIVMTGGDLINEWGKIGCKNYKDFEKKIISELQDISQLMSNLETDYDDACRVIMNENKKALVNATESVVDRLMKSIKDKSISGIREIIIDGCEDLDIMETILSKIEKNLKNDLISNEQCQWLLEKTTGEQISAIKCGRIFNNNLRTESIVKKVDGKAVKFKKLK